MSKERMGGPAFRAEVHVYDSENDFKYEAVGLTIWDFFAAAAMQGTLANTRCNATVSFEEVAQDAAEQADALMAERQKRLG